MKIRLATPAPRPRAARSQRLRRQQRETGGTVPADADVVVKAVEGITWDAKEYTATATDGKVTIFGENDASIAHNLYVLDENGKVMGDYIDLPSNGINGTRVLPLTPGTYHIVCKVPGHNNMNSHAHRQLSRRSPRRPSACRSGRSSRPTPCSPPRRGAPPADGPVRPPPPPTFGVRISVGDAVAQVAGQRRAGTVGAHRRHHRAPAGDRGEDERTVPGIVGAVHPHPAARASRRPGAFTAGSSVAVITSWWPAISAAGTALAHLGTAAASSASTVGATTVTRAPAASTPAALRAAI